MAAMVGGQGPAVRARAVKDALGLLDEFGPGLTAQVRSAVPPDTLAVVDEAPALGWIPLEHDRFVPTAILAELGAARANRYFGWLLLRQLGGPLLRPTLAATRKLFGLSPAAMARAVPLGWNIIYRDFCTPRVTGQTAHTATIRMESCDPAMMDVPAYLASFSGFFSGFFTACEVEGTVVAEPHLEERSIDFRLEW